MTKTKELIEAVDDFLAARKAIRGADTHYTWVPGYSQFERKTSFPIEVAGELPEAARLEIVGFPQSPSVQFRLSLCYNCAICRLDFTDETHLNTMRIESDGIPYSVGGPHFHSWPLNRRFFKGAATPPKLHNAEIELPPRDRLL
jgi:hypothetical protein